MTKITWEDKDKFVCEDGVTFGVVLDAKKNLALIIRRKAGTDFVITREKIPATAVIPQQTYQFTYDTAFAHMAALVAYGALAKFETVDGSIQ